MKRSLSIAIAASLGSFGLLSGVAHGLAPLPTGASAARVAQLVAASHKITAIPKNLVVPLQDIDYDGVSSYFKVPPSQCLTMTSCVYGSTTAKRSIVLFGDSHALMWVPAVNPIAIKDKYKLVLLYQNDCSAASVTFWDTITGTYMTACNSWRASSIAALKSARPSVVLLASLTSLRYSAPGKVFTSAQWRTGLETTISKLKSKSTKMAVLGDLNMMSVPPPPCLAANQKAIQKCASANPNPTKADDNQNSAEESAAKIERVRYVNTLPWICTKSCSPIVGNMMVYMDNWHLTATYSAFLSKVMATDLAPLLKRI